MSYKYSHLYTIVGVNEAVALLNVPAGKQIVLSLNM